MDAISTLKREHATCRSVTAAARRRIIEPEHPDAGELQQFVDFFRFFAHSCHDPKEEELLFAALHRRGLSWEGYPLHLLITEHQALNVTLECAADWLPLVKEGDLGALGPLVHDLRVYLDLLTHHMDDEEKVVFPMAEHWLSPDDKRELEEAFTALECAANDHTVHIYYERLAERLAAA
jgi:hemerythrin-like domain-containing protein